MHWPSIGRAALVSGTAGALASAAVLAVESRRRGGAMAQPVNATSHWLHGAHSGNARDVDLAHTGVGFATHHASGILWGVLFEALRARDGSTRPGRTLRAAVLTAGVAAAVDYGLVPRQITPGWEHSLPGHALPIGFAGLAAGLFLGGLLTDPR